MWEFLFRTDPATGLARGIVLKTVSNSTSVGTIESSVCAARGEQARKIMWAREVGRTRDEQLQVATTDSERQLIARCVSTAWKFRAVASAIQEKCVADKEKESRLAAEAAATAALRVSLSGGASSAQQISSVESRQVVIEQTPNQKKAELSIARFYSTELQRLQERQRVKCKNNGRFAAKAAEGRARS